MRLWSLHPSYLDAKGLVALWREGLLAKACLEGKTKGYNNHPQLNRFKGLPLDAINSYLTEVYKESLSRGYRFDSSKISLHAITSPISVTNGQMTYELKHLLNKLAMRDLSLYEKFKGVTNPKPHPMFHVISGPIESWEKI